LIRVLRPTRPPRIPHRSTFIALQNLGLGPYLPSVPYPIRHQLRSLTLTSPSRERLPLSLPQCVRTPRLIPSRRGVQSLADQGTRSEGSDCSLRIVAFPGCAGGEVDAYLYRVLRLPTSLFASTTAVQRYSLYPLYQVTLSRLGEHLTQLIQL
jgi:hypothetical protein